MIRNIILPLYLSFFIIATCFCQNNSPNILLIIADDMGVDVTPGYQENDRMPSTPSLDKLRENGLTFTNTWASPQCTPTRASIMSGKYGIKTGVMRPPGTLEIEHQSLFSRIKEFSTEAYAGAVIGKWHISSDANYSHPSEHEVDHYEGLFNSSVDDYYQWDKVENEALVQVDEYVTTHLTDNAIDWISTQNQPWFLWLAHPAPHAPFHVPPADLHTQNVTTTNLGKYVAAIEAMDHEIGRLIESMDEETLDNTVIIFIGDNGTPGTVIQNYSSDHSKGSLYEGGIRVPMIASGKGVSRKGELDDNLNHAADLYATILELTGVQLQGGLNNSMSLKPLFSCSDELNREFIYADYEDGNIEGWAIRNMEYKLIEDEEGRMEFYKITEDILEENDLIGNLSGEEESLLLEMQIEAQSIRNGWSCQDGIQNGEELVIDDCFDLCTDDNTISTENIGCCEDPEEPSVYYEFIQEEQRRIYTNNFPSHSYCYNSINQMPSQTYHEFGVDLNPFLAEEPTKVVRDNGRPARYFGVAKNGVIFAPAPAQPFIFENQNTGEFNWDWVFEPTNNQGSGPTVVGLDCASAHTGGQGYHYHGNMFEYAENELEGISTTSIPPVEPLHIGWAADGFPIVYRFGPDQDGNIKELHPSYQLKPGLRSGDGITEPCGAYSGKYTYDYQYLCGKGDLDECNGIQSAISVATAEGQQSFEYFYVITSSFPQIPRCLMGNVSSDFDNSNDPLTGVDEDGDGFLSEYDCDDMNPAIHPNAIEIFGNDIDENCDGILTSTNENTLSSVDIFPNPSDGIFHFELPIDFKGNFSIYGIDGAKVTQGILPQDASVVGLNTGVYVVHIENHVGVQSVIKHIVK